MKTLKLSFAGLAALVGFSGAFAFTTKANKATFTTTTYYAQATTGGWHWTTNMPPTGCSPITNHTVYCTLVTSNGAPSDNGCPSLSIPGNSTPDPSTSLYASN